MMMREEEILERRLLDLANMAWERGVPSFTGFLSLNEQSVYHRLKAQLPPVQVLLFGGYPDAERRMLGFLPNDYTLPAFPMTAVEILPRSTKFAGTLTHRDYLGALMKLGMQRRELGDILVQEAGAVILCTPAFARLTLQELDRVAHTSVDCREQSLQDLSYAPRTQEIRGSVTSERLDSLLSMGFHISRTDAADQIRQGLAFVNGRQETSPGERLRSGDLVSLRGSGKFRYLGSTGTTKKGKTSVRIELFV